MAEPNVTLIRVADDDERRRRLARAFDLILSWKDETADGEQPARDALSAASETPTESEH